VDAWNALVVFGMFCFPKMRPIKPSKNISCSFCNQIALIQVSSGAPKGELQFTFGPSKANVSIKMYDPAHWATKCFVVSLLTLQVAYNFKMDDPLGH
jgi:hypothetical protein